MTSQQNARRSTAALLYNENGKTIDAISDHQPVLGFTDIDNFGKRESWYHRIYARYSLFSFIYYLFIYEFILCYILVVAIWIFLGFLCLYMLRVNL